MPEETIMIVEDEAMIAASIQNKLTAAGYSVLPPVSTGKDALAMVNDQRPDIVLMDIQLIGKMSGIEVAKQIRDDHDIPVIYLTAHSDEDRFEHARFTEPYGYLIKPIDSRELLATIKVALYKHTLDSKLRKSEKKYHNLFTMMRLMCDNVPDMIWAKDLEKRFLFANKAICRDLLNAKDTNEPLGKTHIFFAERERKRHSDDPDWHTFEEFCRDNDQVTMDAGTPRKFDEFGNVKGKFLFLDVHKAPFLNERNEMIGTVGSARDVTEHKRAEKELKKTKQTLDSIVRNVPDIIYRLDPQGRITFINDVVRAYGYDPEEMIGTSMFDYVLPVDRKKALYRINERRTGERKTCSFEIRFMLKNFECRDFEIKSEAIRKNPVFLLDAEGLYASDKKKSENFIGTQAVARDITRRKLAEDVLIQAHDQLEHRVKERTNELEMHKNRLEEVNTALNVMLQKRDKDKHILEEKVLFNIKELIQPIIKNLKTSRLNDNQKAYIDVMETFLQDIVSPFSQSLHSTFKNLTISEIRVANLIKDGKTTKEIAVILNSTPRAIEFHRQNLRKKLGIKNHKANLGSHLLSIPNEERGRNNFNK